MFALVLTLMLTSGRTHALSPFQEADTAENAVSSALDDENSGDSAVQIPQKREADSDTARLADNYGNIYEFDVAAVEVPEETTVEIDDANHKVTIHAPQDKLHISDGDMFIVYLDGLPIGYMAKDVSQEGGFTTITVEKPDRSLYKYVDSQGTIELTSENCEFIPAENVEILENAMLASAENGFSYKDGKLTLTKTMGGSHAQVYFSDLKLSYSFSDGGFSIALGGKWGMESKVSYEEDILDDVPLLTVRIMGIGELKISLSMSKSLNMKGQFNGSFKTGLSMAQDGRSKVIWEFSPSGGNVDGQGTISASLRLSGGVDILAASANLYADIGLRTQYTSKITRISDSESVHCQDYKYYVFLTTGAEAKYYSPFQRKFVTLPADHHDIYDEETSPYIYQWHWENGVLVSQCTQGMFVADWKLGGTTSSIRHTDFLDLANRILETNVTLPNDVAVSGSLEVRNGGIDLNGNSLTVEGDLWISGNQTVNLNGGTLTVKGDLIQSAGRMDIGGGTLNVEGDYRLQSVETDAAGNKSYGECDAHIVSRDSSSAINVGGDFVTQSTTPRNTAPGYSEHMQIFDMGTMRLKGNFTQMKAGETTTNFQAGGGFQVIFCGNGRQTVNFENYPSSKFGTLILTQDLDNYEFHPDPCWDTIKFEYAVTGIELSKTTLTIEEGKIETLTAAIAPANANDATLIWMSSDDNVASVENGTIMAKNPGTAAITVRSVDGTVQAECTITVKEDHSDYTIRSLDTTGLQKTGSTLTGNVVAKVNNKTAMKRNFTLYIAVYEGNGKFCSVQSCTAELEAGENLITCNVTLPNAKDASYMKAFLLDDKLIPQCSSTQSDNL